MEMLSVFERFIPKVEEFWSSGVRVQMRKLRDPRVCLAFTLFLWTRRAHRRLTVGSPSAHRRCIVVTEGTTELKESAFTVFVVRVPHLSAAQI